MARFPRKRPYYVLIALGLIVFGAQAKPAHAAINFVASSSISAGGATPAINTSGASLIVVVTAGYQAAATVSDNMNNTWHALNVYNSSDNNRYEEIYYAYNPITSSAQTFTCGGGGGFPSCVVSAWSGTLTTAAVFDTQNGTSSINNITSINTGSITPASTNELLIAGLSGTACWTNGTPTTDSGFSTVGISQPGTGCFNGEFAYASYSIDPSAASIAPTMSWTGTQFSMAAAVAAFVPASGGSTTSTLTLANSGNGSVVSSPSGINCGSTCSMVVNNATQVTLTATPNSGYTTAWSDCGSTTSGNTCTITVNTNTTVNVSFNPPDTQPPSVPANLQATAISSSQINLSWNPSMDNVGVTGYKVYRCQGSSCSEVQIGTTANTNYSDTNLSPSTQYTYTVSAYDAAGNNSAQSSPASATTQAQGSGGNTGSWSNIIAPLRAIDWSKAGLQPTFPDGETTPNPWTPPTRTYCKTVNPLGGGQDDAGQILSAIASCAPGTYVLLAPGTFTIASNFIMSPGYASGHNDVTVRGSSPAQTTVQMVGSNVGIQLGAGEDAGSGPLTSASSNYAVGNTSVVVTTASPPSVGMLAYFSQCDTGTNWDGNECAGPAIDNGGLFVCGWDLACDLSGGTSHYNEQNQFVIITSVTNNHDGTYTVGFNDGLYTNNWSYTQHAMLTWETTTYTGIGYGLEDMTIVFQPLGSQGVSINGCYDCWVKGVRLIGDAINYSLASSFSKNSLLSNNYVFGQNPPLGSAIKIDLGQGHDSDDLILNNILTAGVALEGASNDTGDVIAYNYNRDVQTTYYQLEIQHTAESSYILHEGDEQDAVQDDDTWGTHHFNTYFRNYFYGSDQPYVDADNNPRALQIDNFARFENVVGNALGGSQITAGYQSTGSTGYIYVLASTDALATNSLLRWGNCDTFTGTCRFQISEVPTSLSGNAAPFDNPAPSSQSLPCSFFLAGYSSTSCTPHPNGGTGLSWWKVCTNYPTCSTTQTQPFPAVGPDVSGGPYVNGKAYDNPAEVAYANLPIDPAYQLSYTITSSSWSGGTETLTVSGLPNVLHLMGGFQLGGVSASCIPTSGVSYTGRSDNEILMTNSGASSISYALASNPGSCGSGTFKFPDVRVFNEAVYEADSGSGGDTQAPTVSITAPTSGSTVSSTISVQASASDNVGVTEVQFLLDGSVTATDLSSPYAWSWNTASSSNGPHTLSAKAYDAAGNVGTATNVGITVANTSGTETSTPSIASFSANPGTIAGGQASTLSWVVSGNPTPTIGITPNIGQVSGSSVSVTPNETTAYTLTAQNNLGIATAQTTVTVETSGGGGGGGSGGGGGGGGGGYSGGGTGSGSSSGSGSGSSSDSSPSALQALLQSLLAELESLINELNTQLVASFTRNLTIGSSGADVKNLQIFLNDNGYPIAQTGAGSPGHEGTTFGAKTQQALMKFQAKNQLKATGFFGPATRAFMEGKW